MVALSPVDETESDGTTGILCRPRESLRPPTSGAGVTSIDSSASSIQTECSDSAAENSTKENQPHPADFQVNVQHDSIDDVDQCQRRDEPTTVRAPQSKQSAQESIKRITATGTTKIADAISEERKHRKGKRGRPTRAVKIIDHDFGKVKVGLALPSKQYQTILVRRAVRKRESSMETTFVDMDYSEDIGDTSLGMKLSVVGGKVIVQCLTALSDGRASPAQLSGVIQRGDVLLAINGKSLVNLPIDQLMTGLGPLSTPDSSGLYQRHIALRLETGTGLEMLIRSEKDAANSKRNQTSFDLASEMFSIFPMVDQLSGMPLFESQIVEEPLTLPEANSNAHLHPPVSSSSSTESTATALVLPEKKRLAPAEKISLSLAAVKRKDRENAINAFFTRSNNHAKLLASDECTVSSVPSKVSMEECLTKNQLVERGRRALLGAGAVTRHVENIDCGKDVRSFQSWKTTLSLNSRARSRRSCFLDVSSLPVNFGKRKKIVEEDEVKSDISDGISANAFSERSEEQENAVDGDELLLRLAAHDEIWRKQVVEFLEESIIKINSNEEDGDDTKTSDILSANDFSSFLFGERVSNFLSKRKRTQALPPEEITAVLFDLTTRLSASVPNEINASGSYGVPTSQPCFRMDRLVIRGSESMLAYEFLVNEALPAWSKTFRPLPLDQRRLIWPVVRLHHYGTSTAASTITDDLLTLDSMSTGINSMTTKQRARKNLREQIEEQELDTVTREETCFLLTYLFTQSILPRLFEEGNAKLEEVKDFINLYGAYLSLQTCFACAAYLRIQPIVDVLLDVSKHDARHREIMKLTSKASSLVLYEPTMLSAIVQRLHMIPVEPSSELRRKTIDLCASAYPDLQPWQVKETCQTPQKQEPDDELTSLYYNYLTQLLHPQEGHGSARKNVLLVKEWCDLSVHYLVTSGTNDEKYEEFKENFTAVASISSKSFTLYERDLMHLLKLSMHVKDYSLALDIASEIVSSSELMQKADAVASVKENLRFIGYDSLHVSDKKSQRLMKRVLDVLQKCGSICTQSGTASIIIYQELYTFLQAASAVDESNRLRLMEFFAREAVPRDYLQALLVANDDNPCGVEYLRQMRIVLRRAARESVSSEFSVALMKVKHARMANEGTAHSWNCAENYPVETKGIWQSMALGNISCVK